MDLVQSEYGWLDEQVLDLPVCRLRQIVANVTARQKEKRAYERAVIEWQTKTTVTFIAASVPLQKGQKNPLIPAAEKISLRMEDDEGVAEDDGPMEEWLEGGSKRADNAVGSYEALTRAFGG